MTFSQKFFGFDNIVQNQQNGLTFFFFTSETKLQLCTKVEFCKLSKSCVFLLGVSEPRKRGHNRVAILESALFRVLSLFFSQNCLLCEGILRYDDRMNLLQASKRLAKLLTAYHQNNTELGLVYRMMQQIATRVEK